MQIPPSRVRVPRLNLLRFSAETPENLTQPHPSSLHREPTNNESALSLYQSTVEGTSPALRASTAHHRASHRSSTMLFISFRPPRLPGAVTEGWDMNGRVSGIDIYCHRPTAPRPTSFVARSWRSAHRTRDNARSHHHAPVRCQRARRIYPATINIKRHPSA